MSAMAAMLSRGERARVGEVEIAGVRPRLLGRGLDDHARRDPRVAVVATARGSRGGVTSAVILTIDSVGMGSRRALVIDDGARPRLGGRDAGRHGGLRRCRRRHRRRGWARRDADAGGVPLEQGTHLVDGRRQDRILGLAYPRRVLGDVTSVDIADHLQQDRARRDLSDAPPGFGVGPDGHPAAHLCLANRTPE